MHAMVFAMKNWVSMLIVVLLTVCLAVEGHAQLQITEVMFDSRSAEPQWEWFEVRNTGPSNFDLDGAVFDDFSTASSQAAANIVSIASGGNSTNTIVGAGEVAVLYNGSAMEFSEARFRAAWNLSESVPLVAIDGPSSLNNGGDAFGIWANFSSYSTDLSNLDEDDDLEVASFRNALVSLDYSQDFPSASGASIQWNAVGNFSNGANWFASDESNSSTSLETFLAEARINDSADVGNPGVTIGNGSVARLLITEIMYNPASDEPTWEWIELHNGTGTDINFAETPHFMDDAAGSALGGPNITEGSILAGEIAVLYNASLPLADIQTAWGQDINYIAVEGWPSLNNGGDRVGIWSDAVEYELDNVQGSDRTFDGAIVSVEYFSGGGDWPGAANGQSIGLMNLDGDENVGTNWVSAMEGDGDSRHAAAVVAAVQDHAGGDFGTPGVFNTGVTVGNPLDFDSDGDVDSDDADQLCGVVATGEGAPMFDVDGNGSVNRDDMTAFLATSGSFPGDADLNRSVQFADFLAMSAAFGSTGTFSSGDFDCNGQVQFADFLVLSSNFGRGSGAAATVPEPTGPWVSWLALAGFAICRPRRS